MTATYKELEMSVHEKLYNNVLLLTRIYSTTKEFNGVFRRDMFVKNNSAAFHQVIYYIFTIVNPELTKSTFTCWPLYEAKLERIFRKEVIEMIGALRHQYPHANLPNIMISQIVSPGGFAIAKLMLKLSNLAMYEHLKKSKELLEPIKPHKNSVITKLTVNNIQTKSNLVEAGIEEEWQLFIQFYNEAVQTSVVVISEQTQVEQDLCKAKKQLEERKQTAQLDNQDSLKLRISELELNMGCLEEIKALCDQSMHLLKCLQNSDSTLEFSKDEFLVPASINHLFTLENKLDLRQLFTGLSILFERDALNLPTFRRDQMQDLHKFLTQLIDKCTETDDNFTNKLNKLSHVVEKRNTRT